jgi:hypothetical protein
MVRRCALRLCFFLASRASAYLFIAFGDADFFSALLFVSCPVPGSELAVGVVLMFFSFKFFQRNGTYAYGGPAHVVEAQAGKCFTAIHTVRSGFPQRWQLASARAVTAWHA